MICFSLFGRNKFHFGHVTEFNEISQLESNFFEFDSLTSLFSSLKKTTKDFNQLLDLVEFTMYQSSCKYKIKILPNCLFSRNKNLHVNRIRGHLF